MHFLEVTLKFAHLTGILVAESKRCFTAFNVVSCPQCLTNALVSAGAGNAAPESAWCWPGFCGGAHVTTTDHASEFWQEQPAGASQFGDALQLSQHPHRFVQGGVGRVLGHRLESGLHIHHPATQRCVRDELQLHNFMLSVVCM